MNKKLSKKEELFCQLFSSCRNGREAAYKSGYTVCPEITSKRLLADKRIKKEIDSLIKNCSQQSDEVKAGLRRIAFSSSADAIKLLFCDEPSPEVIEALDLFNVSEIKRPKAGGIEIKFFDRIKALEKLGDFSESTASDKSLPFYEALERSAGSTANNEV